ncbi:hypothetical protein JB92DRAFT_2838764 [Gautieria morchelliformis]|nr:hypothetical protein JB92DRAFT_2838764 [Gautieria morchelliformis]
MPSAGPPAHLLSSLPISSTELLTPSVPPPLSSSMQPPRSPPPAGTEILYNGELCATPMTSLSQETLAAGIDTTPSASSTQYVTPATETPSANNSQQEMLHPTAEAFAPDETTPDTSADNGFTEIGATLIGTVRPAPEDVVIMQETTTKHKHTDNSFTEIGETLIGTVRPAPEDVVIMQETTTKRKHSELEEVSNPWSKRLRTRK